VTGIFRSMWLQCERAMSRGSIDFSISTESGTAMGPTRLLSDGYQAIFAWRKRDCGYAVTHLLKSEGRGLDSRRGHWNFSLT
jgi:hypothetical protein